MIRIRKAFSLVELIVVIGVVALLMLMVLPAVQKVREAAIRTKSVNNLKQLTLAFHQLTTDSPSGKLNPIPAWLLIEPIKYIDPPVYEEFLKQERNLPAYLKIYHSPADFTFDHIPAHYFGSEYKIRYRSSYAINYQIVGKEFSLMSSIPDGLSSTLFFAEHYAYCSRVNFEYQNINYFNTRRATFAEWSQDFPNVPARTDVVPITSGSPPTTKPSMMGSTFQVRPDMQSCNPMIPQTPHPVGMCVAFADGSVHTLRGGMAETVFWSLVTPAAGEVVLIP